ncbi:MAG TPA: 3'(2'),5'-bisphosphate nucleotidase CysQ [Alphaproteobacteria bacterium]|nr:3'(2'),5'-bisphosphate nucleotidase CysQ [Alphaproteobacteria bacterium]
MREAGFLDDVIRLAERAGERILALYEAGCPVEEKPDHTPVTAADREAEAIILPGLARLTPEIPVVSEEAMAAGARPAVGERFWLVDPLDGTKEFIRRVGEFTVNIALVESGRPVLGVVHAPVTGETYAAAGPGTAQHRRRGAKPRPIAARTPAPDGLVVLVSRFHANAAKLDDYIAQKLTARGRRVKERRTAGSALKFCLIAAGEADLYPRFGPTMEWDTAAGHALLLAAGGRVETLAGEPLRYGKPDFLNPDFVAGGR